MFTTLRACTLRARRRKAFFVKAPSDERPSYLWRTPAAIGRTYFGHVSRVWLFLSKYGLDLLIVVAAIETAISTASRDDAGHIAG